MAGIAVFWTNTALKQRNSIFRYWNERNQSNSFAKKLNIKIKGRLELLKHNPEIGKRTDFANTRTISLGHYSIFYQINNSKLIITSFWDNRQEPGKLVNYLKNG
ncbi:MAG: type II toxin-antitoxin system RelE/ParE family toxin [Lentimicrobium sp.]